MNVGFYYHLMLARTAEGLNVPAYLGVFLDALAAEVSSLTLFLHSAANGERARCDYTLRQQNIRWVDLGPKSPAWQRFLWPGITMAKLDPHVPACDALLVRAPSPLAPAFRTRFERLTTVCYLVVGDYVEGVKYLNQPWWRRVPIAVLSRRNDRQLTAALARSVTMVNSRVLYERYRGQVAQLHEVKTTTLRQADLHARADTCTGAEVKLLFTGRIDLAKGLHELVEATRLLGQRDRRVTLHLAGWEPGTGNPVERQLRELAAGLGIPDRVVFHGFRRGGAELNAVYRMADIFVLPSYYEGFPRTIWEAMANGLPVIASAVGGIPANLAHGTDALLIRPRHVADIVDAVDMLLEDGELRRRLIRRGQELAVANTVDSQTRILTRVIERSIALAARTPQAV